MTRVYLDYNATMPLRPEAREAMIAALDISGNPSSVHAEGRAAKSLIEKARAQVAELVGCQAREVVFTSGATEAASVLNNRRPVWSQTTAHDALYAHADWSDPVEGGPGITLAWGLANSETGVISEPAKTKDGKWHDNAQDAETLLLDVTQAVGRIPWSFAWSGADFAILSSHKIGGPKGVGALIIKQGLDIEALQHGGGQEMGRRSGTENVAGIAGFGAAAKAALDELNTGTWDRIAGLRDQLEDRLAAEVPDIMYAGKDKPRLPNTSCIINAGWKGETQVMQMDLKGFAVSAGSACSSGKVRASRVLRAMGYSDEASASAIRVSLGPRTTEEEITRFAEAWLAQWNKHRARAA
ncbi:cysteine desulfurase family protein [Pseudooceanicola sp. MF1-13]|uniref:cysteine desulfurase family protein n=1 Tax=Pseudooceanicola sp. MF1-13 TaxID=3379095 RepID=UPI0038917129